MVLLQPRPREHELPRASRAVRAAARSSPQQQQQRQQQPPSDTNGNSVQGGWSPGAADAGPQGGYNWAAPQGEGGAAHQDWQADDGDVSGEDAEYYEGSDWGEPEPLTDWGEGSWRPPDQNYYEGDLGYDYSFGAASSGM
jgi:hypothetical protein